MERRQPYRVRDYRDRVERKLDHLHELMHGIREGMLTRSAELDRLTNEVSEMKSAEQSAAALLRKLSQLIRDGADDPAKMKALADDLNATGEDLAAAVVENTPAEGEPTDPVDPVDPNA